MDAIEQLKQDVREGRIGVDRLIDVIEMQQRQLVIVHAFFRKLAQLRKKEIPSMAVWTLLLAKDVASAMLGLLNSKHGLPRWKPGCKSRLASLSIWRKNSKTVTCPSPARRGRRIPPSRPPRNPVHASRADNQAIRRISNKCCRPSAFPRPFASFPINASTVSTRCLLNAAPMI